MTHVEISAAADTACVQLAIEIVSAWNQLKLKTLREFPKLFGSGCSRSVSVSVQYSLGQNAVERDMQTVINGASILIHVQ
jgi:hypothetical protein